MKALTKHRITETFFDVLNFVFILFVPVAILSVLVLCLFGLDQTHWEKIDENCYLKVDEIRNVPLTPGTSYTIRNVYCLEDQ